MFRRKRLALSLFLFAVLFAFIAHNGITHPHIGNLHVTVHTAAGKIASGQDIFGEFDDYYTFGSSSLSTPSNIDGDRLYIGQCKKLMSVPGANPDPFSHTWIFQGEFFTGTVQNGTYRHYTAREQGSSVWAIQESVVFYTDKKGVRRRIDHDHMADVKIPPGGSSVNEPWP